ncbi:MAG: hypothetical protein GY781_14270 [Gammaproteobacteria bacterium]|nr:hypothetical protein [Gammaproteobacteria bacterium]
MVKTILEMIEFCTEQKITKDNAVLTPAVPYEEGITAEALSQLKRNLFEDCSVTTNDDGDSILLLTDRSDTFEVEAEYRYSPVSVKFELNGNIYNFFLTKSKA